MENVANSFLKQLGFDYRLYSHINICSCYSDEEAKWSTSWEMNICVYKWHEIFPYVKLFLNVSGDGAYFGRILLLAFNKFLKQRTFLFLIMSYMLWAVFVLFTTFFWDTSKYTHILLIIKILYWLFGILFKSVWWNKFFMD